MQKQKIESRISTIREAISCLLYVLKEADENTINTDWVQKCCVDLNSLGLDLEGEI